MTVVIQAESQLIQQLSANPPNLADVARTFMNRAFQRALQQLGRYAVDRC